MLRTMRWMRVCSLREGVQMDNLFSCHDADEVFWVERGWIRWAYPICISRFSHQMSWIFVHDNITQRDGDMKIGIVFGRFLTPILF